MINVDPFALLLFIVLLVVSALALMTLHFFPGREGMDRRVAYTLGTLVTVGGPVVAMLLVWLLGQSRSELFWSGLLVTNTIWSGAVVQFCYWIDSRKPLTLDEVHHGSTARH